MLRLALFLIFLVVPQQNPVSQARGGAGEIAAKDGPAYTASGELKMPERYREWIFLTSGLDMSYSPQAGGAGHSTFGNVFVNPSAYNAFQVTGTWPDRTTLVLEFRGAEGASSINKSGRTQSPEIMGLEVHVKDAKLDGGWGFYEFDGSGSAKIVKRPASCYECHESHAAVDTTFVQFYPTLLGAGEDQGNFERGLSEGDGSGGWRQVSAFQSAGWRTARDTVGRRFAAAVDGSGEIPAGGASSVFPIRVQSGATIFLRHPASHPPGFYLACIAASTSSGVWGSFSAKSMSLPCWST